METGRANIFPIIQFLTPVERQQYAVTLYNNIQKHNIDIMLIYCPSLSQIAAVHSDFLKCLPCDKK